MKVAIISDIHSNLEALTAVIEEIDRRNVQTIICLGDVVGYGANPNECIELLKERTIPCVAGNHDKAVIGEKDISDFSDNAKAGVRWNREHLSEWNFEFLKRFPLLMENDNALFVHASPDYPEEFRYLIFPADAVASFRYCSQPVCFVGHTHRPAIFCEDMATVKLTKEKKFIVNVGSVGQPRDGDWRACFALFDTELWDVSYIRVEYDVKTAREKILDAGLPRKLGDRLLVGV